MKPTESLVLTIEPTRVGRHVKYKATFYTQDKDGKITTEELSVRDQQNAAMTVYQRLQILDLQSVKGEMAETTSPPHATEAVPEPQPASA
jgi:glycerol-3-phosphate responsive antiterminator